MQNDELPWDDGSEIDPELWYLALLEMIETGESKRQLIYGISQKSGLFPEEVESIIASTVQFMTGKTDRIRKSLIRHVPFVM